VKRSLRLPRFPRPRLRSTSLLLLLIGLGAAGAQLVYSQLSLAGRPAQSVKLFGAEYISQAALAPLATVSETGGVARVEGQGHVLLLPIDEDVQRATTTASQVQLDGQRLNARTATRLGGKLVLPLETLAQGLGAAFQPGQPGQTAQFVLPAPVLTQVTSLAGARSDRLVLDLNRDVTVRERLDGGTLTLALLGAQGSTRTYTTRGAFLPRVQVTGGSGKVTLSLPLPVGSGYRYYRVQRPGGVRLVLDVGPGIEARPPELIEKLRKPQIVLDPLSGASSLEVARAAAEKLSRAGWQVALTRTSGGQVGVAQREELARRSDVFVTLDEASFPGSARNGVALYEGNGAVTSQIINAYREAGAAETAPYLQAAVGPSGESRQLSDLLRGELKVGGVRAARYTLNRQLLLGEAPHAALLFELGWSQDTADRARLADSAKNAGLAEALARAVATYLSRRINLVQP
jgi:N-acetylmuramoyl-L-alanine amidase